MSRKTKVWLVVGASLILIGTLVFSGVMSVLKWDFSKLSTPKYQAEYAIDEGFKNISVETETSDVVFVPAMSETTIVSCYEDKNVKHTVKVENDTLVVEDDDNRKWYQYIGINFGTPKITVFLPIREYEALCVKNDTGNVEITRDFKFKTIDIKTSTGSTRNQACATDSLKIKTSTGKITLGDVSAGDMDLSVSTGKINLDSVNCDGDINIRVSTGKSYLTSVKCKNLTTKGDTGDVILADVVAKEKFNIQRSTGDVSFEDCDAAEIFVKTDTGNVKGSLLTDKVFIVSTDTGKIEVPKTTSGGRCEITTDTGNIKIET